MTWYYDWGHVNNGFAKCNGTSPKNAEASALTGVLVVMLLSQRFSGLQRDCPLIYVFVICLGQYVPMIWGKWALKNSTSLIDVLKLKAPGSR